MLPASGNRLRLSISLCTLALPLLLTGCFGTIIEGQKEAPKLEAAMHEQMAKGDLAGIYDNADPGYKSAMTREKSDALFSAISRKLGAPTSCKAGGTNVVATPSGTTITATCETIFSKNATGVETFNWRKSGDKYRLFGYHINSNELIER